WCASPEKEVRTLATDSIIPPLRRRLLRAHPSHICAFFHNRDEEYDVLLPFIEKGFASGNKAVHIVDPKLRKEHLRRLEGAGIDVPAVEGQRQLEVRGWQEGYLPDGQ